jgi:hypothetical protein
MTVRNGVMPSPLTDSSRNLRETRWAGISTFPDVHDSRTAYRFTTGSRPLKEASNLIHSHDDAEIARSSGVRLLSSRNAIRGTLSETLRDSLSIRNGTHRDKPNSVRVSHPRVTEQLLVQQSDFRFRSVCGGSARYHRRSVNGKVGKLDRARCSVAKRKLQAFSFNTGMDSRY